MKRFSVIVARSAAIVALGAMTTGLAACGGHSDSSGTVAAPSSTAPAVTSSAVATATSVVSSTTAAASSTPVNSALGTASRTPCSTFRTMDVDSEKALMEKILAENPGSKFAGSPDVALGTAKLVCLAHSEQNQPVAVAIGVTQQ